MIQKRILYLIEDLGRGGAERRLVSDLRRMDRTSFEPIVCHLYPRNHFKEEILPLHIPIHCLGLNRFSEWPKGIISLIQVIKKCHVDLIHTQLFGADVVGRIVGRLLRIPVVSTIQSTVYEPGIPYFQSFGRQWIDSWTGRLCNRKFVAVSETVKQSICKRLKFREEDIAVIYNTVDMKEFSPGQDGMDLRHQFGFSEEDILLIYVGKMNPPKGHRYLMEALPRVISRFPQTKLLLVGDGPSRKELETLDKSLGLENHLLFLGERKDVKELLAISDLFIFPTLSEGMPLALLEAMAMEKPCIASDIPPIREVVKDRETGLLVPPKGSDAMAEAILSLLNDPEKGRALGSRGRKVVIEKFSAEKSARLLERLYLNVLNGKFEQRETTTSPV